jgi:monofunctional glycosyltransferase
MFGERSDRFMYLVYLGVPGQCGVSPNSAAGVGPGTGKGSRRSGGTAPAIIDLSVPSASKRHPARAGGKRRRSWPLRILAGLVAAILAFEVLCGLNLLYLRHFNPWFTTVQLQRRLEALLASERYEVRRQFVPLEAIPLHVRHAVIVAEDGRFFEHEGIDWAEVGKVIEESRDRGRPVRGASTISQQLVKNLFLTTHRSGIRKAFEFTLVPLAELVLTKDRILELYLNEVEWGPGVYGIGAAARFHYRTTAARLTRDQAARLAACLPDPRRRTPERMNHYSQIILNRMASRGW